MSSKDIALFEYAYLVSQDSDIALIPHEIAAISPAAFAYLRKMALGAEQESRLFRLCSKLGVEALQVQHYAGVIFTPDGTQIEVLPKLGRPAAIGNVQNLALGMSSSTTSNNATHCADARNALLIMLQALKEFAHIQTDSANIRCQKMSLLDVFISQFLDSVNELIRKGIRSDYVRCEDNMSYLKGKLNTAHHLRKNIINKQRFFCEYDEFLTDRPANRLLHSALDRLVKITRHAANQKSLQELTSVFDDVPLSLDYKSDFSRLRIDRGMNHYQIPLAWAKLILDGFSPQTMKGENRAFSLLFPMDRVFENYVAKTLREQYAPHVEVQAQVQRKSLVTHDNAQWFRLKPDMVMVQNGQVICVLDTKWKLLDPAQANGSDKYGLQQADFYQMFAYGHHYFDEYIDEREMFLVYPAHANFTAPIAQHFDFSTTGKQPLRLWVVPFVIDRMNPRLALPEASRLYQSAALGN
ncbi:McrC family protein [Plesiomonas shigelloides]|uniref:McrC family protein n=2 Tax=Plesiomonas shigelloides TaxID=703 RepID=UPI002246AA52|nr:McrC family protein [Plesiomonas shigelloides]MCX2497481.1 McrC family protein [Plesiomonas shigelloides]